MRLDLESQPEPDPERFDVLIVERVWAATALQLHERGS